MEGSIRKSWDEYREKGKKILEEMGKEEYDRKARKSYKGIMPPLEIEGKGEEKK
jgi:hypothetical protein